MTTAIEVHGTSAKPGFERSARRLRGELRQGTARWAPHWRSMVDGETVVDLWGGHADGDAAPGPGNATRSSYVFSTTKGDRRDLCATALSTRASWTSTPRWQRYWPEFAAGRARRTLPVRYLLSHQRRPAGGHATAAARGALRLGAAVAALAPRRSPGGSPARPRLPRRDLRLAGRRGDPAHRRPERRRFLREEIAGPLDARFPHRPAGERGRAVGEMVRPHRGRGRAAVVPTPATRVVGAKVLGNPPMRPTSPTRGVARAEIPPPTGTATPARWRGLWRARPRRRARRRPGAQRRAIARAIASSPAARTRCSASGYRCGLGFMPPPPLPLA